MEFHWISSGIPLNFPVAPGSLVTSDLSLVLAKSVHFVIFSRVAKNNTAKICVDRMSELKTLLTIRPFFKFILVPEIHEWSSFYKYL